MAETIDDAPAPALAETPFPSAETTRCPYPYYKALREADPVHRLPSGEYVASRHADITHVLRHPELFSSRHCMFNDGWMRASTLEDLRDQTVPWGIVNSDDPVHATKRMLAMEMFKPERLKHYAPMVEDHVDDLLDAFVDRGECDFVSEFADILPARVVMSLFNLPAQDLGRALEWGRYEGFGMRYASPAQRAAGRESILDLGRYIRERAVERVENPGEDELSLLIQRHLALHGELDMANLVAEASNLFIGGIVTTTHLLGNTMAQFIRNPTEQAKARAGEEHLKNAIEESLRIDAPAQLSLRLVTQDTELGGVALKAGSMVIIVWGSANRDAEIFDHADRFDIERPNLRSHLAFGGGGHLCLGARLGRLEVLIAFQRIFARMTNLRFAPGKNDFASLDAVIFRGLQRLNIEFDRV